jgi:hypothetical protein
MNRIEAILTLDMENIPANFQEILKARARGCSKMERRGNFRTFVFKTNKKWCCFNF